MFKKISRLMEARGVSPSQLSKDIGLPLSTFGEWKQGANKPSFKWLVPIAKYFGVSVEYFSEDEK